MARRRIEPQISGTTDTGLLPEPQLPQNQPVQNDTGTGGADMHCSIIFNHRNTTAYWKQKIHKEAEGKAHIDESTGSDDVTNLWTQEETTPTTTEAGLHQSDSAWTKIESKKDYGCSI